MNNLLNQLNSAAEPVNNPDNLPEGLVIVVMIFIGVIIVITLIMLVLNHKFRGKLETPHNVAVNNSTDEENKQTIAVRCPRCGSLHIEFVTEYHKCVWLRLIASALIVLIGIFAISYLADTILGIEDKGDMILLIFTTMSYLLIQVAVYYTESKTHVQGVCRDCGNIWLLN